MGHLSLRRPLGHVSCCMLTYGYGPDGGDLHHGFGSGVEAAVLDGVADGDVSVQ